MMRITIISLSILLQVMSGIQAFQTIPSSSTSTSIIHQHQHQPIISYPIRLFHHRQKVSYWRGYKSSSSVFTSSSLLLKIGIDEETEDKTIEVMDDDDDDILSKNKSIHYFAKTIENEINNNTNNNIDDDDNNNNDVVNIENQLPFSNEISTFFISPQVEILDLLLILLSSFFVAIGTLPASKLLPGFDHFIIFGSDALTYMFGIAFFLRWYGVGQLSMKYLTKPLAILDIFVSVIPLATILPTFAFINIPTGLLSNSGLVNLRLLRILRFSRVLQDLETFGKFEVALGLKPSAVKSYQLELARVVLSIFTLLSVASGLIYSAEHQVNPDMTDYFTALYFGLTTLTTGMWCFVGSIYYWNRLVLLHSSHFYYFFSTLLSSWIWRYNTGNI